MTQVAVSSGRWSEGLSDLLKELKCEIDFVNDKMENIDTRIHEVENETFLNLNLIGQDINDLRILKEITKEFNDSMFVIKKRVKECDRQLRISHVKVQDFSRRRIARITGNAVTTFGKGQAVVSTLVGVSPLAIGAKIAVSNQNNEEERRFREFETTIEYLREQLKQAVDKLKGYISNFQSKNIPVANW